MVKDKAKLSAPSADRDVPVKAEEELVDQFQLLEAAERGGSKDTLIAASMYLGLRAVWVLEGSQWVQQCGVPRNLPNCRVCFCAVADGFVGMGGVMDDDQTSPDVLSLLTCLKGNGGGCLI